MKKSIKNILLKQHFKISDIQMTKILYQLSDYQYFSVLKGQRGVPFE